jgi:D-3-phosphoglycerate dehydrogenase
MKVLVTDYAWKSLRLEQEILERVGASLVVAKTGSEDEFVQLAADVDGILTCWKRVSEKVIRNAPRCQAIARYGIGLDNIDVEYATKMGIVVTNVPAYCVEEVSDHAMALLLSLARKVAFYDRAIKSGSYDLQAGTPLHRLKGQTLGIVGFGKIGRAVYRKARGFGLKVIVYDSIVVQLPEEGDVDQVSFKDLLKRSDYISIHAPLTSETRHLFNLEAFRQMKPTAFVINAARGELIDTNGLLRALDEGLIAGAGLDVLPKEPPDLADPLVRHPKAIITPHAAFNSEESLEELQRTAASQMADVLSGKLPQFVVNPEVLRQSNLRAVLKAR